MVDSKTTVDLMQGASKGGVAGPSNTNAGGRTSVLRLLLPSIEAFRSLFFQPEQPKEQGNLLDDIYSISGEHREGVTIRPGKKEVADSASVVTGTVEPLIILLYNRLGKYAN